MLSVLFIIIMGVSPMEHQPFSVEEIMHPDHGSVILSKEEVELQNKYRFVNGVVRGDLKTFEVERIPFRSRGDKPLWMRKGKPAEAFRDMVAYAMSHGYEIRLNSAYRTYRHQMKLWRRMPHLAGEPGMGGYRTHQTGCSIDISGTLREYHGEDRKTMLYWWLKRFAKKFNFVNDVPSEPWHWTYMGPLDDPMEVGGE